MGDEGVVNFIMLNPSTADDNFDDPTIRRCVGFAKRWGYSGISVTNLFAYRATDPSDLIKLLMTEGGFRLAIGEENTTHLDREAQNAQLVVCAWGDNVRKFPKYIGNRDLDVIAALRERDLFCIRKTKMGNPVHPVRESYTEMPALFFPRLSA